jgi:hypothetical protein
MLAERRTRALRDLSSSLAAATDEIDVARRTAGVLAQFEFDLPFLLYYGFASKAMQYELLGHHGIAPGSSASPFSITPDDSLPWPFEKAITSLSIVEVDNLSSKLRGPMMSHRTVASSFPSSCRRLIGSACDCHRRIGPSSFKCRLSELL